MTDNEKLEKRVDENMKEILRGITELDMLSHVLNINDFKIVKEIGNYLLHKNLGFKVSAYNQNNDKKLELSVHSWIDPDDRDKAIEELIRYTFHPEKSDPDFAHRIFRYKPRRYEKELGEDTPCFHISREESTTKNPERYIAICFEKYYQEDE